MKNATKLEIDNFIDHPYSFPGSYPKFAIMADGMFSKKLVCIPHNMSTECKYDTPGDPCCQGCKQAKIC